MLLSFISGLTVMDVAGLLGDCVGLFLGSLVVWKLLRKSKPVSGPSWTRFVSGYRRARNRASHGTARYGPIVFVLIMVVALIFIGKHLDSPPNYVLMHNVHVLERIDDQTFKAEVKDIATGEWYPFVAQSCPEFIPTHEIQRGVTLLMLQYVEDRTRSCLVMDGKWGGYTLLRDGSKPVISDFVGFASESKMQ